MAVTVDELPTSPQFSYSGGRLTIKRQVLLAWADVSTYIEELVPAASTLGNLSVSAIGQKCPGFPNFRVDAYDIKPFHSEEAKSGVDSAGLLSHELAQADINYTVPPVGTLPDTSGQPISFDPKELLSHQMTGGGQFLTFQSSGGLVWDTDATRVPEGTVQGIFVPTIEHTIVDHIVESPNWAALDNKMGQLNNDTFRLRGADDEKETLMYLGYDSRQVVMTTGLRAWEIAIKVSRKKVPAADSGIIVSSFGGHNHFYDEDSQGWYRVRKSNAAQGGSGIFETFDFATLFQAGANPT